MKNKRLIYATIFCVLMIIEICIALFVHDAFRKVYSVLKNACENSELNVSQTKLPEGNSVLLICPRCQSTQYRKSVKYNSNPYISPIWFHNPIFKVIALFFQLFWFFTQRKKTVYRCIVCGYTWRERPHVYGKLEIQ